MTKLVEIKPENLVSYGALKVGFYDAKNPNYNQRFHDPESSEFNPVFKDYPKYLTYIYVLNGGDDRTITQRAAGSIKVPDGNSGVKPVLEAEAYKRAHDIYLKIKSEVSGEETEIERLKAEIAALKSPKQLAEEEKVKKAVENSAPKKLGSRKVVDEAEVKNLSE